MSHTYRLAKIHSLRSDEIKSMSNDYKTVLATTRSVRRRIDFERAVDRDTLLECIELAVQAPTGVGDESWRFLVVTEADKKIALAQLYRRAFDEILDDSASATDTSAPNTDELSPNYRFLADHLQDFPALIMICREGRPPTEIWRQVAFYGSVLPAAWSLMLALRGAGIGATWTTLLSKYEAQAASILSIPDDATATILLPVGYTANAVLRPAARSEPSDVTFWDTWGACAAT